jgi:Protein of unknown function (DUF4233)
MRVLASSVLAFEWVVLGLAIPVAVNVAGVSSPRAWATFAVASVLTVLALGLLGRPVGVWLGWGVQAVAVAGGLVVPLLGILGAIFAGLYFAAIRLGSQVDQARAERQGTPSDVGVTSDVNEGESAR